MYSELLAMINR